MPEETRRSFIGRYAVTLPLLGSAFLFLRNIFLYLFPQKHRKTFHKYLVGKTGEVPPGGAAQLSIGGETVFLVHLPEGFKVFSAVCTHLGCLVKWQPDRERFFCPCHRGVFDKSGAVVAGPPPAPLRQYPVTVEGDRIYVSVEDKTRSPWA